MFYLKVVIWESNKLDPHPLSLRGLIQINIHAVSDPKPVTYIRNHFQFTSSSAMAILELDPNHNTNKMCHLSDLARGFPVTSAIGIWYLSNVIRFAAIAFLNKQMLERSGKLTA